MIDPYDFLKNLTEHGVNFFAGVPDSLLSSFSQAILDFVDEENHIIAANEGGATGLAIGSYLSTNKVPVVYLQNSGLGNIINPLLSLADSKVYGIPIIFIVGWRGEPNVKDEPQHVKQGEITEKLIGCMDMPYSILSKENMDYRDVIATAIDAAVTNCSPYFLIIKKGTFQKAKGNNNSLVKYELYREEVIEDIISSSDSNSIFLATTGMTGRELYEIRDKIQETHNRDFLCIGGMGHVSQIALMVAKNNPDRQVYCIDGDGAALMHMGALAINGHLQLNNFKHIIINNEAHESVGGQPTICGNIKFESLGQSLGYGFTKTISTKQELISYLKKIKSNKDSTLLEVKVNTGHREDLGRPKTSPQSNKEEFMKYLGA